VIQFPAVSVYCYRLSIDPETRPGLAATTSADGLARLPLRMHLLIAAWDTFAESELEWLGLAAQVLESDALLAHIHRHAVNENFTWRLRWAKGTLAIWDNRCTQHFALNDYHGHRREMVRTSVKGTKPKAARA